MFAGNVLSSARNQSNPNFKEHGRNLRDRSLWIYPRSDLSNDRSRVDLRRIDHMEGDSHLLMPFGEGPEDGAWPSQSRQQRGMEVDDPQ